MPTWQDVQKKEKYNIEINLNSPFNEEIARFEEYLKENDFDTLIRRYPVRETPALNTIAKTLGFQTREKYESAVRQLLTDDDAVRNKTKKLLGGLAEVSHAQNH